MLLTILKYALLIIAVWTLVALALGCLIGKGIHLAQTYRARPQIVTDARTRARGGNDGGRANASTDSLPAPL